MLAAHAHSGVAAKMSGVPGCLRGAGNRDFAFRGSGVNASDGTHRRVRGHAGLGVGQPDAIGGEVCDERRRFTEEQLAVSNWQLALVF